MLDFRGIYFEIYRFKTAERNVLGYIQLNKRFWGNPIRYESTERRFKGNPVVSSGCG